jgi:hypothetical protein
MINFETFKLMTFQIMLKILQPKETKSKQEGEETKRDRLQTM